MPTKDLAPFPYIYPTKITLFYRGSTYAIIQLLVAGVLSAEYSYISEQVVQLFLWMSTICAQILRFSRVRPTVEVRVKFRVRLRVSLV